MEREFCHSSDIQAQHTYVQTYTHNNIVQKTLTHNNIRLGTTHKKMF